MPSAFPQQERAIGFQMLDELRTLDRPFRLMRYPSQIAPRTPDFVGKRVNLMFAPCNVETIAGDQISLQPRQVHPIGCSRSNRIVDFVTAE